MPITFDSGLALPIRTTVRRAVIAALQPLLVPAGFVEVIDPIGFTVAGPHDELGIDLLYKAMRNRTPAILVSLADAKDEPAGAPGRSRAKLDVEIFFISSHRNDLVDGRTEADAAAAANATADQGLDVMLEAAWQLLLNLDLGKRATPLVRLAENHLISDEQQTVWRQHWQTMITLDVNLNRNVTQLLQLMVTTLKPTGDEPDALHMVEDSPVG